MAAVAAHALRITRRLRFRLTLSYVVFFSLLLILLGLFFRHTLEVILEEQVSEVLNEEWAAIKGYLRIEKNGPQWFYDSTDPDEDFIVERLRRVYFLADRTGTPVEFSPLYKSLGLESPAEVRAALRSGKSATRIRTNDQGVPFMIRSGMLVDDRHKSKPYFVAIGRSLAENSVVVRRFERNYFTVLPLLIALSSLLGWFMAGRALTPVNSVAQTAQRITHSNLGLQIPLRAAGDELDQLIDAFNRMMERLNRSFEQIRQFSTDVSHELRTPLTVVRGELEVALFTAKTVEDYRNAMVNALEDVERLSNIVRALLMLSQAESGQLVLQKSDVNLAELVSKLVEEFQIPAETEQVTLRANVRPSTIHADPIQIERLISNLLSNAIKYTPAGGEVKIEVASEPKDHAPGARIRVRDTGVGIATDHLPHIFDRFYRVPSAAPEKGLGLGLSFVAWIVQAHGGEVHVDSQTGKGTTFSVWLPSAEPAHGASESQALAASEQLH